MPTDRRFALPLILRLKQMLAILESGGRPTMAELRPLRDTIDFLQTRLTEAAQDGCHHCGEGAPGSPCFWCGLRN